MAFSEAAVGSEGPLFLEEPDDPRVLLPAHRIGDVPWLFEGPASGL